MAENDTNNDLSPGETTGETTTTALTETTTPDLSATTSNDEVADRIVRSHVLWAMGAGLIPIPLADIASVTAIQMDALKQLAAHYKIDFTEATGKRFVASLAGGAAAKMGASALKSIPVVGTVLGGLSMSAMSGASTYAVCQVAINHFLTHGNFLELDLDDAKKAYKSALEKGRELVATLNPGELPNAEEVYQQLNQLEADRDAGTISDAEYEARKAELLEKISPDPVNGKVNESVGTHE